MLPCIDARQIAGAVKSAIVIDITNNQMKEAMWNLGFRPTKINTLNWTFKIKKSSPIFQRQIDGRLGMPMLGSPTTYAKG